MEYCSMGDLSQYIKRKRATKSSRGTTKGLSEAFVRQFLKQLADALKFLRSHNLVHRDIKPQNLLLLPPEIETDVPFLKVADFGFARILPNATLADTLCGSPLYMGPEILSYQKYDAKADLWSVGAVLYEMLTGRPPFKAQNHLELLKNIQENEDRIRFPDEKGESTIIGSDLKDLIRKLLKKNPVERISFEEFFMHPAVLGIAPTPSRSIPRPSPSSSSSSQYHHHRASQEQKFDNTGDHEEDDLHEYVVLDRRMIETNQLADEISESPRIDGHGNHLAQRYVPIPRRGSNNNDQPIPSPSSTGSTPPFAVTRERKVSTGSAGSALAKALSMASMASVRLFGAGNSPPKFNRLQSALSSSPRGFLITDGGSSNNSSIDPQERQAMKLIERAAYMAHAVACYADTKYDQLIQGRVMSEAILAEEAMLLYIKALSLLELGMNAARQYWNHILEENMRAASNRLNDAVQWMRERFNECLDRASYAGQKCHSEDQNSVGTCVEKLLYDRALEMSRAAAVYELVGENISGCEHDYQTAIWMLEAILEVNPDDDTIIEEDDHRIISKFIESIRNRITVLRKKKDLERAKALDTGVQQYDQ
ncbi:kinase-like domain-containing protein [Dichotomocladium elegans]|nr:kinase-like domain-containing protein [Dichotomocladium elegans]